MPVRSKLPLLGKLREEKKMVQEIEVTRRVDGVNKTIKVQVDLPATAADCINDYSQEVADNLIMSGAKARAANALRNIMAKGLSDEVVLEKMAQWRLDKAMERTRVPAQVQLMRELNALSVEERKERLKSMVEQAGLAPTQEG
jgi:hypothetical protein